MVVLLSIGSVLRFAIWLYTLLLWARLIVDWITVFNRGFRPRGGWAVVVGLVFMLTDPPIKMFRKILPPIRLGMISLDLGWMLTMVCCWILQALIPHW